MKKMGYDGKGLENHGKGIRKLIQPVMRSKNEDLEYGLRNIEVMLLVLQAHAN